MKRELAIGLSSVCAVGFMVGVLHLQTMGHQDRMAMMQKDYNSAKVKLVSRIDHHEKLLTDFLGASSFLALKTTVTLVVPVSYDREVFISNDLRSIKGMRLGDWVRIEDMGLFKIAGLLNAGTNLMKIKGTSLECDRYTKQSEVSWVH